MPDYLGETQRSLLLEAAECAEFPNIRLCPEGFAIAFANQHYNQMMNPQDSLVAMYVNMGATHSTIDFVQCANVRLDHSFHPSARSLCCTRRPPPTCVARR